MSSGKLLLGVLAGVAAGALAGILLAPDKGSATRKRIYKKGDEYADHLQDKFNEFLGTVRDGFDKAKDQAFSPFVENGKSKSEEFKATK